MGKITYLLAASSSWQVMLHTCRLVVHLGFDQAQVVHSKEFPLGKHLSAQGLCFDKNPLVQGVGAHILLKKNIVKSDKI